MSSAESAAFGKWIEHGGFRRDVAGDAAWRSAVAAARVALENKRGLLVFGKSGRGKSCLLRAVERYISKGVRRETIWLYCKDESCIGWMKDDAASRVLLGRTVFVDDIGSEETVVDYGNRKDVVGDFIQKYYEHGSGLLFGSTNLSSIDLNAKYGTRVLSRLLSMCVCYKMEGEDKRKRMVIK